MRIIAIGTVLAISIPALQTGAQPIVPASAAISRTGNVNPVRPGTSDRIAATSPSAQGTISLEARQLQGAEAISVDGNGPPNVPVTITLLAIVSSEVPTIVVSRHDVVTDVAGRFGTVIPIAAAYEEGTILKVVATSIPGVGSASAQLVTTAPNGGVDVPLEH